MKWSEYKAANPLKGMLIKITGQIEIGSAQPKSPAYPC